MSERAREPLFFEEPEEEAEPEPSTESAGSGGFRTAVGSEFGDWGGEDESPLEFDVVWEDYPEPGGSALQPRLGTAIRLLHRVYSLPIEDLKLSKRAYEGLKGGGLVTVGQVLKKTEGELLSLRNFGRKSYEELREKLDEFGILPYEPGVN